jgi:hypothetical protein
MNPIWLLGGTTMGGGRRPMPCEQDSEDAGEPWVEGFMRGRATV